LQQTHSMKTRRRLHEVVRRHARNHNLLR
jgi:hypothetical protein